MVSFEKEEPESVSVPTAMSYNNVSMGKSLEMRRQPIVQFGVPGSLSQTIWSIKKREPFSHSKLMM